MIATVDSKVFHEAKNEFINEFCTPLWENKLKGIIGDKHRSTLIQDDVTNMIYSMFELLDPLLPDNKRYVFSLHNKELKHPIQKAANEPTQVMSEFLKDYTPYLDRVNLNETQTRERYNQYSILRNHPNTYKKINANYTTIDESIVLVNQYQNDNYLHNEWSNILRTLRTCSSIHLRESYPELAYTFSAEQLNHYNWVLAQKALFNSFNWFEQLLRQYGSLKSMHDELDIPLTFLTFVEMMRLNHGKTEKVVDSLMMKFNRNTREFIRETHHDEYLKDDISDIHFNLLECYPDETHDPKCSPTHTKHFLFDDGTNRYGFFGIATRIYLGCDQEGTEYEKIQYILSKDRTIYDDYQ